MNKSELIEHIAKQADISKAAATRALEAMIGGVKTMGFLGLFIGIGFELFRLLLEPQFEAVESLVDRGSVRVEVFFGEFHKWVS